MHFIQRTLSVAICAGIALTASAQHEVSTQMRAASTEQLQADLDELKVKAPQIHFKLFHDLRQKDFEAKIEELKRGTPSMTQEQWALGVTRLIAAVGDGHTSVMPLGLVPTDGKVLPFNFYEFDDGLFIVGADVSYAQAAKTQVVSIGELSSEEVLRRVEPLVARDNAQTVRERRPMYLRIPSVLVDIGAAEPGKPVKFRLSRDGKPFAMEVQPLAVTPDALSPFGLLPRLTQNWTTGDAALPQNFQHFGETYRMEYEPAAKLLYVQFNRCASDPKEPVDQFAKKMEAEITARHPEKVVLDLRLNTGGEGYYNRYFVRALVRALDPARKDQFYVLIGRRTFSASGTLLGELEKYTRPTLVGESAGARPNSYGNHAALTLTNSRLSILFAPAYFQNSMPSDTRTAFEPDISIPVNSDAFFAGRDEAMERVRSLPVASAIAPK